ncbi:hypothetical protein [Nitratifractor sp.]|uniref:hypothetical protein n=1 Tax=Nitratifractor sp. TaxID=2268144 RepID=UPI0025E3ECFC|nr:hypothetical protein [Nitratifractor sp.]
MPKNLLDFIAPGFSSSLPIRRSLTLAQRLAPEAGEQILMLGYDEGRDSLAWMGKGVDLLILCQREKEAAQARKAGLRAVLAHAEYLWDRERFDGVILPDASYRLFEPDRAVEGILQALRPGGRLLLELPLPGHLESTQRAVESSVSRLGLEGKIEKAEYCEAEQWRRQFRKRAIRLEEAQVVYRHHMVPKTQLREWTEKILSGRALLLDGEEHHALSKMLVETLEAAAERDGTLTEEEVLLRVAGQRV